MSNLSSLIDAYGDLKAEIANLEIKQQALKDALAEVPKGAHEGERYRLNVIEAEVKRVDWQKIAGLVEQKYNLFVAAIQKLHLSDHHTGRVREILNEVEGLADCDIDANTTHTTQRSLRVGARNGKKVAA